MKNSFLRTGIFALALIFIFAQGAFCQSQEGASQAAVQASSSEDSPLEFSSSFSQTDQSQMPFTDTSAASSGGSGSLGTAWVFVRMVLVLAFVIALIWFIFRFLRKKSEAPEVNSDQFLRKVASISLAPGKSVQVITLIDKAYILGVGDDSVSLIAEVNDAELINSMNLYADKNDVASRPKNFEEVLELFMPKKKQSQPEKKNSSVYDGSTKQILNSLKNKRFGKEE